MKATVVLTTICLSLFSTASAWAHGSAAALRFSTQPESAVAGLNLGSQPVIEIVDANGEIVTSGDESSSVITLTVSNHSHSAGVIFGATSVKAVNGVATYTGISLHKAGDFTLAAVMGRGQLSVNSAPFTVTAGAASPLFSKIQVYSDHAIANGRDQIYVIFQLIDGYGNPVSGVDLKFTSAFKSDTLTQPATPTDANGYAVGELASLEAGHDAVVVSEPVGLSILATGVYFEPDPTRP